MDEKATGLPEGRGAMTWALSSRQTVAAIVAGLVGAVLIHACLLLIGPALSPGLALTPGALYTFIAAALVGRAAAAADPHFVWLGVGLHLVVSLAWAFGYVYAARSVGQLLRRPLISGLGFGLVIYFVMLVVLLAANLYTKPTPGDVGIGLLANCVFFGLPVALIVAGMAKKG
jgi:hypothetical protein